MNDTTADKKPKKGLLIATIATAAAGVATLVALLLTGAIGGKGQYSPIEEFAGAFNALGKAAENADENYDIEKTIRIINGLEVAQHQSANFDEFLEYMARQDYSQVPADVMEAKQKMMPVLQEIYLLQKEYDELNFWTTLVQGLANDALGDEIASGIAKGIVEEALIGQGVGALSQISKLTNYAFDQYSEEQRLKGKLAKKIETIRKDYLHYLEEFTPVYVKYMTEWDRLCIDKDKAYIDLYSNQPDEVVKDCDKILSKYPTNREALLLKAMGLTLQHRKPLGEGVFVFSQSTDGTIVAVDSSDYLREAQKVIDRYIDLYPDQSAPALLLQGLIMDYSGNHKQAFSYYDQAAIEFPRQSEHLTDLLNCYRTRTYLNNSREGIYLLTLYKSTMEGFGFFSPNLIKALYYDQNGDHENCSREIYNHFFRRSNQTAYDCMLNDLLLCETYMPNSFNRLLPERNYVDITITKQNKMLGLASDATAMTVEVDNRSDQDLENLRIFVCLHYTDMYSGEYYIAKLPTFNRIMARSNAKVDGIALDYADKNFDDIAHARAIAMTDNSICWLDNIYNATENVDYNEAHNVNFQTLAKALDSNSMRQRDAFLDAIGKSDDIYRTSILQNTRVSTATGSRLTKRRHTLSLELPRELILINPTFKLNKTLNPTENYLKGSFIHLEFTSEEPLTSGKLYIASPYLNYVVTIGDNSGRPAVTGVENLAKE